MKILTDTVKPWVVFLAVGIVTGFFVGCTVAVYTVYVQNYLPYELYLLAAYTWQEWINTGIGVACAICLIMAVIIFFGYILAGCISWFGEQPRRRKFYSIVLISIAVCVWAIRAVHQNWWGYLAPSKYHIKTFGCDAAIVLFVLVLAWVLMRIRLGWLKSKIGSVFMLLAAGSLVILVVVNGALLLYASYAVPQRPNVILISIDTLRADHVGCYGYDRNTTPNIDGFARGNVRFKNAFVHDAWTLPSHMSMLTGLYSLTHGVGADATTKLPPAICTLAEILKNSGYDTMGFASTALWMSPYYGFGDGFDVYEHPEFYNQDAPERNAEFQNAFIEKYLRKSKKKNNFIFIHYFDVHSDTTHLPYDAPPPYDSLFVDSSFELFDGVDKQYRATNYLSYLGREKIMPDPQRLEYIKGLYDNSIAYTDKCIGDLFDMLKAQGLYDNSIIIITADHGEAFGEHGLFVHGNRYCYVEEMHVPFIVKLPDTMTVQPGIVIEDPVEIIDIMPTILDYVAIDGFPMDGMSLKGIMGGKAASKEYIYGLTSRARLYIRSEQWKLLGDDLLNQNRYRLYNLENDPGRQYDVVLEYPEIEEHLEQQLRLRIEESLDLQERITGSVGGKVATPGLQRKLHDNEKERLRSLGYVL